MAVAALAVLAGCGDEGAPTAEAGTIGDVASASAHLLDPVASAALLAAPPAGMVVLDVRTPEEYTEGHLAGAVLVDFSAPTFAAEVGALDRDVPYFVYCRSGNRSAQAVSAMQQLGFGEIYELDGGIVAWQDAGQPLVTG